jgi:dephospho-CoA kinase
MPFVVGLTGGIGSGKSAAAKLFAGLGAEVVDTDTIAHALTGPGGAALAEIQGAFGPDVIDAAGALDRAAMRRRVFGDPAARAVLEGILHPKIREESARRCAASLAPYVVLVVPLLVESGTYRDRAQRVAVVDCAEETQIARTMARSQLTLQEVRAIMAAQASRAARLAVADDIIGNEGSLESLRLQVVRLDARYRVLAKGG